jgi:hypothetical protein
MKVLVDAAEANDRNYNDREGIGPSNTVSSVGLQLEKNVVLVDND